MHGPRSSPERAPRLYGRAFAAVVAGLLISIGFVGVALLEQNSALSGQLGAVDPIVNGNVRVLSQTQRELLRLDALIASGNPDRELVRFHADLVTQRIREAGLSYQINTLGSPELLAQSGTLGLIWTSRAEPLLDGAVDGSPTARAELRALIDEIELGFNRLVSEAEINRRFNAVEANTATSEVLGRTRGVLVGGGVSVVLLLAGAGLAGLGFVRFDRQRARTAQLMSELNDEMRILSAVASHTNAMVVITDADGVTTWVNDAFVESTGYPAEAIVGRRPGDVLQGPETDPDTVARMARHVSAGEAFTCEVVNYSADGVPYWVRIEVQPVTDDHGTLVNFIAVESDITADREAQRRLERAKEVAEEVATAKSSFLATMSHEIRTPLNAVIGLTSLLQGTPLDDQQREYVTTAASSGRLLLDVINDILSWSALGFDAVELERRPFSPQELVEQTVELARANATAKDIRVTSTVADDVPTTLEGDPTRLRQVLVNIVGNAVKFTDEGHVAVHVDIVDHAPDEATVPVRIRVVDTGIGIPADQVDRLFLPFSQADASTTRRYGGTGLGLAISNDLVALMGGRIDVESTPGTGTEVVIQLDLPVGRDASPGLASTAEVDAPPSADLRVLLVEDDPVNQMVAFHMLDRLGLTADVADNGQAALEAVHRCDYDVVLMDVHMPVMDGPTAARHIRQELPAARQPTIVAMTANAMPGDRERLLAADMDDYVAKPVRLGDLATTLRAVGATQS
ncbi:hybrid sensor histidine kinase/response regulator [Euzebya rosea]|uniref:hybrid sensor histidine kinase/response regulator n=1 Tax=Euzebya rosea TaxID=2052804 RepID=UPI000D3EB8A3|nr:PAS domain-containing hybrid sensor histidine kinase/response regulator [Euzebya rosea]